MRKFKNYEAVKINSIEEAMEFLQYLEAFTNLRWFGGAKPTDISPKELKGIRFPVFIEVLDGRLLWVLLENTLGFKTKIIPLSEFIKPKVTYTREQAEAVFRDASLFHNNKVVPLNSLILEFLDHKFPKSTLEQVTEAVKDLGDFTIEQTSTGDIIISPIKN